MIDSLELYIYVDGVSKRIELFKDEVITLSSSIQNANDISKTFTDYTQSFTVPATPYNNNIFKHWYENSVQNGFDHRKRYDAYIEIDTIIFREGNIQIESVSKKDFQIDNYKITFYGNLTQLKDRFGEDMLSSLDYSSIDHSYSFTEIYNRITSTASYEVRYPLIGASYSYEYGTNNALYDVRLNPINWIELAPACKVSKIFEFIEDEYNISFTGDFITNYQQFTKLWLYLKKTQASDTYSSPIDVVFQSYVPGLVASPTTPVTASFSATASFSEIVPSIVYNTIGFAVYSSSPTAGNITIKPNTGFEGTSHIIYIYEYDSTASHWNTIGSYNSLGTTTVNIPGVALGKKFKIGISSYGAFSFSSTLRLDTWIPVFASKGGLIYGWRYQYYGGTTQSTTNTVSMSSFVPQIKVSDFFMGIIKMFNLIINPVSSTEFELIPLELYYDNGRYIDITEYTMADEMTIDRPKLFNKLKFSYQKSNNVLNTKFNELFAPIRGYDYGDLSYIDTNSNEKQTYDITLPFENILWQRSIVGTFSYSFLTAAMLNKDLKSYIPKPVLMYENGLQQVEAGRIRYTTGASSSNYFRFSNEIKSGTASDTSDVMSINWTQEVSPWYLTGVEASLSSLIRAVESFKRAVACCESICKGCIAWARCSWPCRASNPCCCFCCSKLKACSPI